MKTVYIIAWLTIAAFLGWSGNLLLTIQTYWAETSDLHQKQKDLGALTNALQNLNRPGNDVLEHYEVARNQAAFERYSQQFQAAHDAVLKWVPDDDELEPLIRRLEQEQATLSEYARETLDLAAQREQLQAARAPPGLIGEKETLAAASMARMDRTFQSGLNILLEAKSHVVDREQHMETLQRENFKELYVMLIVTIVASALSVELVRRTMHQREALRESSARINAIMNNVVDGILTVDDSGRIESANPAAASMFGFRADELVGSKFTRLIDRDCREIYLDHLRNSKGSVIASFALGDCEKPGQRKDGSAFPIELAASHVALQGRHLLVHIVRDITARRLAEANLRQAASVFKNITEGIVVTDEHRNIQSVNPAFTKITQYQSGDVIGKNPRILQSGRHDDAFYREMWASVRDAGQWQGEIWNKRKNGETYPQWLTISAIKDDQGRITNYIGVTWDITELKASERMKEEFITTVSHELRTPLTSVLGSLGLLVQGDGGAIPEQAQELLQMAYSNSGRLVRLIGDILDFEKMSTGKMRFQLKTQELMPLVHQTIDANRTLPEQSGINIELDASLPGARVTCDAERLMQVLTNLLSNATKFSPPNDRVAVSVSRRGPMIRVAVTDHGPGVPEDFHSEVFEKFTQAETIDLQHKGGIGLGLSIAKIIVAHHGGRIDFESEPDVRTTFFFEVPEYQVDSGTSEPAENDQQGTALV